MKTSPGFDFLSTVYSHGWYSLPPFSVHGDTELVRILRLTGGEIVRCSIAGVPGALRVRYQTSGPVLREHRRGIRDCVRTMLRLDEDLAPFHAVALRSPQHRWIARMGAGRLLRAPTVFEDLVKMICTTNCTWSLTTMIVRNLVYLFGPTSKEGWRSFPRPEDLAGTSEKVLRKEVKAGYRSPYLIDLANRVASGEVDPEQWRTGEKTWSGILQELYSLKGIGPYASQNMLRLLGHYDFLGLDSWVRSKYYSLYHEGRAVKDGTIERRYARYGRWRGLLFWLEMTKEWHDEKFPRGPRELE